MKRKAPRISKGTGAEFSVKFADLSVTVKAEKSIPALRREAIKTLVAMVQDRIKFQALLEEYDLDNDSDEDDEQDEDEMPIRFFKPRPKISNKDSWMAYA